MGMDQSIYVGIYVICLPKENIKEEWGGCQCENNHHFKHKQKFCPECGEPLKDVYNSIKDYESWHTISENKPNGMKIDLEGLFCRRLSECCDDDTHDIVLIPEERHFEDVGRFFESQSMEAFSIEVDSNSEIHAFEQTNKDLLVFMATLFTSVKVQWGVIIDWS